MADFLDMVNASMIGSWLANPSRGEIADNAARQRASTIQDNFGTKPESIEQYRREHGGAGILKGLAVFAAVTAVGALFGSVALTVGLIVGTFGALSIVSSQSRKVQQGYSNYLDDVSAQGRAERDRGMAPVIAQEYDNGHGIKSFVERYTAEQQQAASNGTFR